jgi:hypothetical protein
VWDEETGNPVTDLLDETATPISAPKVVDGWVLGAGLPTAVRVASFSLGKDGKRYPLEPANAAVLAQTASDAAASSATAAQSSADSSAASAALVGAPAGNAIDAHLGGDSTNLVPAVAGKVDRDSQVINLADHVTNTGADVTAALNTFLASLVDGDEVLVGKGTWRADGNITISKKITLRLRQGAVLDRSAASPTADGITVTAAGVTIKGSGSILSPAVFDGANVQPTYAVVHVTGNQCTVKDITLTNVPKVGVYFDDCDDPKATDITVEGNYPAGSYTGVETGHFGIAHNPGTSGRSGRLRTRGNLLRSCVQGIFLGNYGPTATGAYGPALVENTFDGCHNHGIYNAGGIDAVTITGNTFTRCSLPIAVTGSGHAVTGNTIYTHATGNNLDLVGISLREAVGCTVTGNTIKGDAPASSVIIDVANFTGNTLRRNVIADNTIDVTGGNSSAIRVGRTPQTTTCSDNIVSNNTISALGNVGVGVITVGTGSTGFGNKVTGNTVVVKGESHGIYLQGVAHSTVQDNSVRYEYDAPSAKTLGAIVLNGTSYCTVSLNDIHNPSTFGTNVALRGVWEQGASSKNRIIQNSYHGDLTKLASFTPIVLITNSDCYIDDRGIGSPSGAFFGAPGSRWSREDGGAGTSLYVKETANTSATWQAK